MQYSGPSDEDLNLHLSVFLKMCATFKINGACNDAIRLILFPFSLKGRAKLWLISLPAESITTWVKLGGVGTEDSSKILSPTKAAKFRGEINNFHQIEGESLYGMGAVQGVEKEVPAP